MDNKEWESFSQYLKSKGVVKIGRNVLGVITNLIRESGCSLGYNEIELMWETWQGKSQITPDGFVLVPSGVLDLTRFMCETWTEIDKFVYKNCQNLELYPLIQGSKAQSAIRKIGKQKFNSFAVGAGIQAMIEAQEQSHELD